MKNSVKKEIEELIEKEELNCSIKEFKDYVDWWNISRYQKLSEDFIREFKDKVNWRNISRYQKLSEDSIREFQNKVDWDDISCYQQLSENVIIEFKNKVDWENISRYQKLSLNFIKEFKDKVNWNWISRYQKLSLDFIREFQDKVSWNYISRYQQLSENFIREFEDKVNWHYISSSQKLSEDFIEEFQDKIDIKLYNKVNKEISYQQKIEEVKEYCEKYNLEFDEENKCFYAYRNHDIFGRGIYNKSIFYEKSKYYKDWHIDMRKYVEDSFGLGIFPEGNTKVKVLIEDWGVEVNRDDGKARIWGFEIV